MSPEESEMSGASEGEAVADDPEFLRLARDIVRRVTARQHLPPSVSYEDVYQSLILKLLPFIKAGRLKDVENVSAWLYTAASHEARRFLLKELKRSRIFVEEPGVFADERPDFAATGQIERGLLLREIEESLDEKERRLLGYMRHQYTTKQIGQRLGISTVAAGQRISRLKVKIRKQLFP